MQLDGVDPTLTLVANYFSRIFSSFGVITVPATPWNPGHSVASIPDRGPVDSLHRSMSLKTSWIKFATSVKLGPVRKNGQRLENALCVVSSPGIEHYGTRRGTALRDSSERESSSRPCRQNSGQLFVG